MFGYVHIQTSPSRVRIRLLPCRCVALQVVEKKAQFELSQTFTLRNWIYNLDVLLSVHMHCPSRTHLGEA